MTVFFETAEFATEAKWLPNNGCVETANILVDTPTEEILGGRVLSTEYLFIVDTKLWVGIKHREFVEICGGMYEGRYVVREVKLYGDGRLKGISVSKE